VRAAHSGGPSAASWHRAGRGPGARCRLSARSRRWRQPQLSNRTIWVSEKWPPRHRGPPREGRCSSKFVLARAFVGVSLIVAKFRAGKRIFPGAYLRNEESQHSGLRLSRSRRCRAVNRSSGAYRVGCSQRRHTERRLGYGCLPDRIHWCWATRAKAEQMTPQAINYRGHFSN